MLPINARSTTFINVIPFDTKNPEQVAKAYALAKRMVAEAGKRGYGEYRAHLSFMDLAADQFGFNDHALRRFNERSRTPLTRTGSSPRASRGSGEPDCGRPVSRSRP